MKENAASSHRGFFRGKKILVTGGTGSIGSEIVRQILPCRPAVVRVFSNDETAQAELAQELGPRGDLRFLIGDVRDVERVRLALSDAQIVFHAAALKHVASCEYNPFEAVQTNILGTQNLVQASIAAGVGRMILVSTDKAVNPTSTMGATKLVAERIVTAANQWAKGTIFAVVRFGNVLGSRGSIAPLVERRVAAGKKVEFSDKRMTRFVMTIQDAVRLVLRAAVLAKGGEIFTLKMSAVQLETLVQTLVKNAWQKFKQDVKLLPLASGQRGRGIGEKLEEHLLTQEECLRTEDAGEFLVVQPEWRPPTARVFVPPPPSTYRSGEARGIGMGELRRLLRKARV